MARIRAGHKQRNGLEARPPGTDALRPLREPRPPPLRRENARFPRHPGRGIVNSFVNGFTGGFTAKALGGAAALLVILVVLHMVGWDPASLGQRLRARTEG